MSQTLFALPDFGLVFGAVLGFGFWQVWVLRRDKRRRATGGESKSGKA